MKLPIFLSIAIASQTAVAQVAQQKSLTLEGARRVIASAQVEAKKLGAPGGVVAVVDQGGNLMALERLDGTFAAGANISIGKARTAVLFKKPTKVFEDIIKNGRTSMVALNDFTPLQGGIPIVVDGEVVGGVGGSGAASAQSRRNSNRPKRRRERVRDDTRAAHAPGPRRDRGQPDSPPRRTRRQRTARRARPPVRGTHASV